MFITENLLFYLYLTQSNSIGKNISSGWVDQLFL